MVHHPTSDDALSALAAALATTELRVATCESLTGGKVYRSLTGRPDVSPYVLGALVLHDTDATIKAAGVRSKIIERYGLVSDEVALAMAVGARRRFEAGIAVATTGVGVPTDARTSLPVGTVCVAVVRIDGYQRVEAALFDGDRDAICKQTVLLALDMLAEAVEAPWVHVAECWWIRT